MAYVVTKIIKGRRYRYRQRSYRVGKKVKTESVYLGPADTVAARMERRGLAAAERHAAKAEKWKQEHPERMTAIKNAPAALGQNNAVGSLGIAQCEQGRELTSADAIGEEADGTDAGHGGGDDNEGVGD